MFVCFSKFYYSLFLNAFYFQAIALRPMNPALYEARAAVSEKVDLRDSLNDSRKVMELDPTNPKVRTLVFLLLSPLLLHLSHLG